MRAGYIKEVSAWLVGGPGFLLMLQGRLGYGSGCMARLGKSMTRDWQLYVCVVSSTEHWATPLPLTGGRGSEFKS
ncbi:predicted protein [Histoplasma mississippiense (nom. inval.)]|uniref:predicted protein n=1 Tax=Ajellomyces capsulatus (strain NAm1 / WU24) TaxID=2059318 RepID=UPI000157BF58|nr:predicted protein [Histoplasma mississippiense (nom. inval.)]EDN06787.1 predicted protein [Histoplasma mississippiense (nom. inval.)]